MFFFYGKEWGQNLLVELEDRSPQNMFINQENLKAIYSTQTQVDVRWYFSILGRIRKIMIESIFEIDDIFGQEWKMMIYCFEPSLTFYPEIAKRIY